MDPSQIHRPEEAYNEYNEFIISRTDKTDSDFRNYNVNLQTDKVRMTYTMMHENQTMDFVKRKVSLGTGCSKYVNFVTNTIQYNTINFIYPRWYKKNLKCNI